ncbi:MAG: PAS domain S-box protein [Verrucomicrobiae bacterium]|nr:PAS domain S-box protein [Verrucomicrobiae bacterium]
MASSRSKSPPAKLPPPGKTRRRRDVSSARKTGPAGNALWHQLAIVVQHSDDAIFSLRRDGTINSWNPAAERIFGLTAAQALGQPFQSLFPPNRRGEAAVILERLKRGEHLSRYEIELPRKEGPPLHVALTLSPIRTRPHLPVRGAAIIARDNSEQKRAEEKLRQSEAFYHSLVENLPQNIFRKELDLRFSFANHRFCQLLGRPLEEVIGRTDYDFFPPELAAKYQEDDRRVIQTGEAFETVEINQPPGGRKIYVHVCKTPIRDASGKIIGVQGIFWDITASREAEEALRQSEERYRTLLNSVTDYIYTVEFRDGKPFATRHGPGCLAVTGYSPEDYAEAPYLWYLMIHPEDREKVVKMLDQIRAGHTEPLEHRIIHRDGSVRWVRNTQVPRKNEQGEVVAYDGLISDITERKEAEEKLRQANLELSASRDQLMRALQDLNKSHEELKAAQMLLIRAEKMETVGRLAAGLAHEVKNPLAILLSGIEYLEGTPAGKLEDVKLVLEDMRVALTRADGVIRSLLDFAAAQELGVKPENLNTVIEQPLALMRHDFSKVGVQVVKRLAPDLPPVPMDRNKIEQVLVNLFMNALQAMPEGGVLTVTTRARTLAPREGAAMSVRGGERFHPGNQVVEVLIEDTGIGIPAEMMARLYEPFFTTKPAGKGTGLGLAVSKKILEMHGADLHISNRQEGGVQVVITFKI